MCLALLLMCLAIQEPLEKVPGDDTARLNARMGSINQNLVRLSRKLEHLRNNSTSLADEIGQLELERALISRKIEKHELELEDAAVRIELNTNLQGELRAKALDQQKRLGKRLRTLYKRGAMGHSQILLKQSRLSELINAFHYAKILTRRDQESLAEFRFTIEQLDGVNKLLEQVRANAEVARVELNREERELKQLLDRRTRRMREIKKEERQHQQLLKDLELEKEELRMMVRRLSEEDTDPMELRVPISRYRGRLDWPVPGKVKRRFGIYRDPEFKTRQRRNGIGLETLKGEEVRCVYSGKVIYADWFKSYGNLVIIDHGEKVISFYAHCDRLLVEKGDFVDRDNVIAVSGDTGSLEGAILHFEVRNKTLAEDPLTWLKKR